MAILDEVLGLLAKPHSVLSNASPPDAIADLARGFEPDICREWLAGGLATKFSTEKAPFENGKSSKGSRRAFEALSNIPVSWASLALEGHST